MNKEKPEGGKFTGGFTNIAQWQVATKRKKQKKGKG